MIAVKIAAEIAVGGLKADGAEAYAWSVRLRTAD
jgi:hypothetical protein